jgi:predicted amidohydrolase
MTFRIAVVQPIAHPPGEDKANVADAVRTIERAAGEGADFVCFPETYPGPWRMPATFDPTAALVEAAAKHGVHAVFGTIAPIDANATGNPATAHNLIVMAYPDGRAPARYRRTHPNGPWIYTGGKYWEFQYAPGDEFPVFDTVHGKVGLAMCSEVYMPEVTRALALRGAELIFMPAGVDKNRLWATWRTLIFARAIENLAIVVTTQNLFDHAQRGLAMVAAPEEILFESTAAGMSIVDVSLDRLRYLRRTRDEVGSSANCAAKQGVLGPQWQRPELYDAFYPRPLREAAE